MTLTRHAASRGPIPASLRTKRTVALVVTGSMSAASLVLAAGSAAADTHQPVSQAEGRFLSGSLDILNLAAAQAKYYGGATVTDTTAVVDTGPLNVLGVALDLEAVRQVAIARPNGSSLGASGAVTAEGAIDAGGSSVAPAGATLDLDGLLPGAGIFTDLDLSLGALSARATQAPGAHGTQASSYQIADMTLTLDSAVLSGLLGPLLGQQDQISGAGGVQDLLEAAPLLDGLGVVDVDNLPGLSTIVANLGTQTSPNGALTANLNTGVVTIDLDHLASLNNLPPNTPLLPRVLAALNTQLVPTVQAALDELTADIEAELDDVTATTTLLGVATPVPAGVLDGVLDDVLDNLTGLSPNALAAGTFDNAISDLLDGILALTANVQAEPVNTVKPAGSGLVDEFTVTALRINLLAASGAVVNLASASVGPTFGPADAVATIAPPKITEPDDGDETEDRTPPISGTGVPGAKVTVREGPKVICTAVVRANRTWTCTPSQRMSLGSHTITAKQTKGGLTSRNSNSVTFRIVSGDDNGGGLPNTGAGALPWVPPAWPCS